MLKTMIIILEMHLILNILITNLTIVTDLFAARVLKAGITYHVKSSKKPKFIQRIL